MVTDIRLPYAPAASWGSIIGGVVTVLAVSILLSLLGTALGFGMIDAQAQHPLDGVGTTFGIWSAVCLIVSLGAGGFVAGRLAGINGLSHGFLVWGTSLLLTVALSVMVVSGAARMTGQALGAVSSAAGSLVGGVGSAAGKGVGNVADWLGNEFDLDLDTDVRSGKVSEKVEQALRKSHIKALQPDYLKDQLKGAKSDVEAAIRKLRVSDAEFGEVADNLIDKLQQRADGITSDIDRDEVVQALTSNTDMSQQEAERTVDQMLEQYQAASQEINQRLDDLRGQIEQAKQQLKQMEEKARQAADKAADVVMKSALWAFFALLIGAVIATVAGLLGARSRPREAVNVDERTRY